MPGPSSGARMTVARDGKGAYLSQYRLGNRHALRPRDLALAVFLAPDQSRSGEANVEYLPIDADSR